LISLIRTEKKRYRKAGGKKHPVESDHSKNNQKSKPELRWKTLFLILQYDFLLVI